MKKILIVGGTSGLGLALARLLNNEGNEVSVTGRKNPQEKNVQYLYLDITHDSEKLVADLSQLIELVNPIDLLIYSAGFSSLGAIDRLDDQTIKTLNNVGLMAPQMLLQRILRKQGKLGGFIAITSTSQWIPRVNESVYCAVKAGLAMFVECISLDEKIGKVLVAGPAGMNTKIQWERGRKNDHSLLDPNWVAEQIVEEYSEYFKFKLLRLLREPPRTEVLEKR